ncbi:MAG: hypothetical protein OXD46_16325 [Chloroflexi bacterium]|nr:hypothetical protein [Chloroflexota bacterium]
MDINPQGNNYSGSYGDTNFRTHRDGNPCSYKDTNAVPHSDVYSNSGRGSYRARGSTNCRGRSISG